MFFLIPDILPYPFHLRFAYRYGKIFISPLKLPRNYFLFVYPIRRFSFQQLYNLSDGLFSRQGNKAVNMLMVPVNFRQIYSLFFCVVSNVVKNFVFNRIHKVRKSAFCSPDRMYPYSYVRHRLLFYGLKPVLFIIHLFQFSLYSMYQVKGQAQKGEFLSCNGFGFLHQVFALIDSYGDIVGCLIHELVQRT